ncbi:MAG: xanthine dehydrogenase family protein [Planctomycetes bacterium]|nr:xanthine dehydrogenase family protein [Planctomycetota bacterium]
MPEYRVIGRRVPRPDAPGKVTGSATYVADLAPAGYLVARLVRSPHPHARLRALDLLPARALPGVHAALGAHDIPGENRMPGAPDGQPILAVGEIRYAGEPIAVVAAESAEAAAAAARAVRAEYEPLPALLDLDTAFAGRSFLAQGRIRRGDPDALWSGCDAVVEGVWRTPPQEHAYLEPNGVLATPDGTGGILIQGSLQSAALVQRAVAAALGWPLNRCRVAPCTVGGAFGGKEEVPAHLAACAALLAVRTRRPVRLLLGREEDFACTPKRHAARIDVKVGGTKAGGLTALDMRYVLDGGAYVTASPYALFRGLTHAGGAYAWRAARIDAAAVRTHHVPAGAFRGTGEVQAAFALECAIDLFAAQVGLDPLDLRRRNLLAIGDETLTGQKVEGPPGFADLLDAVERASDWRVKRAEFPRSRGIRRHGIGVALWRHGVGPSAFAAAGEPTTVEASAAVASDGSITLGVGCVDEGQGAHALLAQVAAEELGCMPEDVRVSDADTTRAAAAPGGDFASDALSVAAAVVDACRKLRTAIESVAGDLPLSWKDRVREAVRRNVGLVANGRSAAPALSFDRETGKGRPFAAYAATAAIAEIEVDIETGEVAVTRAWSAHDIGRALNPTLVEGQVEGGIVQGVGGALLEELRTRDGRVVSGGFAHYAIPSALDAPVVSALLVDGGGAAGPYGAKGLGEAAVVAIAPAIVAAIAHATGARLAELPCTPERVTAALAKAAGR